MCELLGALKAKDSGWLKVSKGFTQDSSLTGRGWGCLGSRRFVNRYVTCRVDPQLSAPHGKRPRVRSATAAGTKARISTRLVSVMFWSSSLILPSPVPDSEASSIITGNGSGWRGNRPCTQVSEPWAGKERTRSGPLLSRTLWVQPAETPRLTATPYADTGLLELQSAFMYLKYFSHKTLKILEIYNQWVLFFFF